MTNEELIQKAKEITKLRKLSDEAVAGEVGSALVTNKGNVYTGISIHAASGLGFCAEVSAIADMLKAGESRIATIVALDGDGNILPPCGRCREMMFQIDHQNTEAGILLSENKTATLADLLPARWQDVYTKLGVTGLRRIRGDR